MSTLITCFITCIDDLAFSWSLLLALVSPNITFDKLCTLLDHLLWQEKKSTPSPHRLLIRSAITYWMHNTCHSLIMLSPWSFKRNIAPRVIDASFRKIMFLKKQYALPSLCTHSVIKPCQFFVRPPSLVALAAQLAFLPVLSCYKKLPVLSCM